MIGLNKQQKNYDFQKYSRSRPKKADKSVRGKSLQTQDLLTNLTFVVLPVHNHRNRLHHTL